MAKQRTGRNSEQTSGLMAFRLSVLSLGPWLILLLSISWVEGRLYGINYSLRTGPDWEPDETRCKSFNLVKTELQQLQAVVTDRVRIYSMTDCNTAEVVLNLTQSLGMQVWLGLWVGPDELGFDSERARFLQLMEQFDFTKNVVGIHVSSEAIYRDEITVAQAIALRDVVKADMDAKGWTSIPVTVADIIDTSIEFPALITVDSAVAIFNQFPFWEETVNITTAAQYMSDRVQLIENQAGGRQIIVTETGWADAGSNPSANVANPASMAKWMNDFVCLADSKGWWYYWFDSYDSDWRRIMDQAPNDVEGHFGIFYQNGTLKPYMQSLGCQGTGGVVPIAPTNAPLRPPTLAPANATAAPTAVPTLSVVETPTVEPVASEVPSNVPSPVPTQPKETLAPSPLPTEEVISILSTIPSSIPSDVATDAPDPALCQSNTECAALELGGFCCPTGDNVTLQCCGSGLVEATCAANNECARYELTDGTCCPTDHPDIPEIDNKYLDCCTILPDACVQEGTCARMSAVEYKLILMQSTSRSAAAPSGGRHSKWLLGTMGTLLLFSFHWR